MWRRSELEVRSLQRVVDQQQERLVKLESALHSATAQVEQLRSGLNIQRLVALTLGATLLDLLLDLRNLFS